MYKNIVKSISYMLGGGNPKSKDNIFDISSSFKCKKMTLKAQGKNNFVKFKENGKVSNLDVCIVGNNNSLSIGSNFECSGNCKLLIVGSDNNIVLGNNIIVVTSLTIYNHDQSRNCNITIGDNTSFYKTEISTYDHESSVTIGEDCMFGYDTIVYNTDGHSIYQDGKLINRARNLTIGNHVWCGWGSTILKNSQIADGCIVGKSAVLSGKFEEPNCALAGIPAKIVKHNIVWDRKSVNQTLGAAHE